MYDLVLLGGLEPAESGLQIRPQLIWLASSVIVQAIRPTFAVDARGGVMAANRADLIRLLEAELDLIEGGGYGLPAGHPPEEHPMLDRKSTRLNSSHLG